MMESVAQELLMQPALEVGVAHVHCCMCVLVGGYLC